MMLKTRRLEKGTVLLCCLVLVQLCAWTPQTSAWVMLPSNANARAKNIAISPISRSARPSSPPLFSSLGGLTVDQENALEVFVSVAQGPDAQVGDDLPYPLPTIGIEQIGEMLHLLDIDASEDEEVALFKYLDSDQDGQITFDDFLPWYNAAAEAAQDSSATFQDLLISRRTVDNFDATPVDDSVLRRAVQCAIAAPNRSGSEPWRFIQIGPETVEKLADLQTSQKMEESRGEDVAFTKSRWTDIPGWCVVTTRITPDDPVVELEDFKSTSCAVQNLMLSMWSEGVGSKWTSGPVQRTEEFQKICGIDTEVERVAGVIWYGFAQGGLVNADPKRRKKGVDDVLSSLP